MSIRHFERRLLRAARPVSATTGGCGLRMRTGMPAWQFAGNGANAGGGRDSAAGSAMR